MPDGILSRPTSQSPGLRVADVHDADAKRLMKDGKMLITTSPYLTITGRVTDLRSTASPQEQPKVAFVFHPLNAPSLPISLPGIAYLGDATSLLATVKESDWVRAKGVTFEDDEATPPNPPSGFILTKFEHLGPTLPA